MRRGGGAEVAQKTDGFLVTAPGRPIALQIRQKTSNSKWDIGAIVSDDHCLTGREKGVSGWAGASGWAYRGGGDGLKQMIPVLEHDVGGDRSQVFEEPVCGASCDDCLAPGQDPQHGGGVEPKGE